MTPQQTLAAIRRTLEEELGGVVLDDDALVLALHHFGTLARDRIGAEGLAQIGRDLMDELKRGEGGNEW